jgi:Tfp pilus assembly protein PilF
MFDDLRTGSKHSILIALILIILTIVVYWPVQNYEFINYDDQIYVTKNFRIQNGITVKSIKDTLKDFHTGNWHPLTMISHMLDWQLFGNKAGGHHWMNVIIHIFNTVLLFLFLRMATGAIWRSAFVAALFALHPINVESVAWISERKNVLSTFFWILTMILYVWYIKSPGWKRYLPIVFSFALGLMSKAMLVTLPFVLLLLDYWPLRRTNIFLQDEDQTKTVISVKNEKISFLVLEKIPLFVLSAIFIYIGLYAQKAANAVASLTSVPLFYRLGNAIISYGLYIKKMFWPLDLAVFYPFNYNMSLWFVILGALLIIAITIFVCIYFRRLPYLPIGWFWYLGTLVPVIGLVQLGSQSMADRYAYVPFIGLFMIIAWGAKHIASKVIFLEKILIFLSVLTILLFTTATHYEIKVWANTDTLFENAIKKNPNNYLAYQVIAQQRANNGENDNALYYYDIALKVNPKSDRAYNNRGLILIKMGRRDEAFESFKRAIEVNKNSAEAYYNIGQIYLENGDFQKSTIYFVKAVEINSDYIEAYNNLGVILIKKGRIQEGILQLENALRINPNYESAQRNLRIALAMKKKQ